MLLQVVRLDQLERREIAVVDPGRVVRAVRPDHLQVRLVREGVVADQRYAVAAQVGRLVVLGAGHRIAERGEVGVRVPGDETAVRADAPLREQRRVVVGRVVAAGQQRLDGRIRRLRRIVTGEIELELVADDVAQLQARALRLRSAERAERTVVALARVDGLRECEVVVRGAADGDRDRLAADGRVLTEAVTDARKLRRAAADHLAGEVQVLAVAVLAARDTGDAREQAVLDDREVAHRLHVDALAFAIRHVDGTAVVALRLLGDQAQRATHRVDAEQRALRAAQHFDPVEIEEVHRRARQGAVVHVVDVDADRRHE